MDKRTNILVIRLSAMGDVAMTAPIMKQISEQNPNINFVFLSRAFFKPFFKDIPNLTFFAFDKERHKGLKGLYLLYKELKSLNITAVADLHFNLRSRIISFLFKTAGTRIAHLNKARAEKKQLTRKEDKDLHPITPMWMRYAQVFKALKIEANIKPKIAVNENLGSVDLFGVKNNDFWVGISPFAQHLQKVYPVKKMEQVVDSLNAANVKTFIFGGGAEEKLIGEDWENKYANCKSTIGKFTLTQELDFISSLDLMISMDSAGMHLASLKGVKVLSVWGATHPFAGFLGFGQDEDNCVQIDLPCRPCSVYGNKQCYRGDFACMQLIDPMIITNKTLTLLKNG